VLNTVVPFFNRTTEIVQCSQPCNSDVRLSCWRVALWPVLWWL